LPQGPSLCRNAAEELAIAASRVNGWLKDNGSGFQDVNERRKE
jgi:hypothetical protein